MTYAAKRILGRDQTATLNGNSQRVLAVLPGGSQLKRPQIAAVTTKPESKTRIQLDPGTPATAGGRDPGQGKFERRLGWQVEILKLRRGRRHQAPR